MSWLGGKKFCKHNLRHEDCPECRVQTKPLSQEVIKEARQILTGNLTQNKVQKTFRKMERKV